MRRPERLVAVLAALLAGVGLACADESVALGVHDLALDLPMGWTSKIERLDADDKTTGFRTLVRARCQTERCETSRETCVLWAHDKIGKHRDGADFARAIYASASERYALTRAALKSSGPGARVKSAANLAALGSTSWFLIETRAAEGYKSVMRADTMIDGRRVVAECRTCDGEDAPERFAAARAILGSVRVAPTAR